MWLTGLNKPFFASLDSPVYRLGLILRLPVTRLPNRGMP
jgi:hypothetical protein